MTAAGPPMLTPAFTERVTARLRRGPLSAGARRALRLYALAAAVVSVVAMRTLAVDWSLIAASFLVTVAIAAIVRPRLR